MLYIFFQIQNVFVPDTGVLALSQYILLDPILLAAILASTACLLRFQHHQQRRYVLILYWVVYPFHRILLSSMTTEHPF